MSEILLPSTLEEFVGQRHAVELLRMELAAFQNGGTLGNVLCVGPSGTGKSCLGRLAAILTDLPYLSTIGAALGNVKEASDFLRGLARIQEEALLLQIDEVESADLRALQLLHPLFEEGVLHCPDGRELRISFWLTTNSYHKVPDSIVSRCRTVLIFSLYDPSELEEIASIVAWKLGFTITNWACEELAERAAGEARRIVHFVEICALYCRARGKALIDLDVAEDVLRKVEIFPKGVDRMGLRMLEFLATQPKRRAGLISLAAALEVHPRDLAEVHEPALLRRALISVSSGGRHITDAGVRYLKEVGA